VQPLGVGGLDLMPGFAGQSGIERDLCQEDPTLEVGRVGCDQTLSCLSADQFVGFQGEGEHRQVRMWLAFPGGHDTGLGALFVTRCP
jgi:hypothetical protein